MNTTVVADAGASTNNASPARLPPPNPHRNCCMTCRTAREERGRQYDLYRTLTAEKKVLKDREASFEQEKSRLLSEIEELKLQRNNAAPVATATGKKRRLEDDQATQGSSENDEKLRAEVERLQTGNAQLLAWKKQAQADLHAEQQKFRNIELENMQLKSRYESERNTFIEDLRLKYQKESRALALGHATNTEQQLRDQIVNQQERLMEAANRASELEIEAGDRIKDLEKQLREATSQIDNQKGLVLQADQDINTIKQQAQYQCHIEFERGLQIGRQQERAHVEDMAQGNDDLRTQIGQYEGIIRQHEHDLAEYKTNVIPQIEGRLATAEAQANHEKELKTAAEEQAAKVKAELEREKSERGASEEGFTSLKGELKKEKAHKEIADNEVTRLNGEVTSLNDQVASLKDQLKNFKGEVSTLKDDVQTEKMKKEAAENRANDVQIDLNTTNAAMEREKRERKHELDEFAELLRASPTMPAMKKSIQTMEDRARNANGVMPAEMAKCTELLGCRANLPDIRREIQVIVDELKAVDGDRAADVTALSNILGTKSKKMKYIRNDVQALVDERKTTEVLRGEFKTLAGILKCNPRMSDMRRAIRNLVQESSERKARTDIDVAVAALAQQLGTESVSMTQIRKDIKKLMQHNEEAVRERDSLRIKQSTLQNEISKSAWSLKKIETLERERDMVEDHLKIANDRIDWLEAEYKVGQPPAVEKIVKQGKIASKQLGQFEGLLWFLGGLYLFGSCVCALAGAV